MFGKVIAIGMVASMALLIVLLQTTTPATIGPLGILIVFILMYMSALGVLTFLLQKGSVVLAKVSASIRAHRSTRVLSLRRSYYFSSVIALAPVMFVGMQSVGTVSVYEIALVTAFVAMGCVYIAKRTQ